MTGQISLPHGKASDWNGDVIIVIDPMVFVNRDGWAVGSLDFSGTDWKTRGLLEESLNKENIAVVRFDNPGVYPTSMHCRENIKKSGLSNAILKESCFDDDVVSSLTHKKYLLDIENLIFTVKARLPLAKNRLILMGFSEGGIHIAHLINNLQARPKGVLMIGSPLESVSLLTKWQVVDRPIETIPLFDLNKDGIVTNEEITSAYKKGVGNFMLSVSSWLSPQGKWDKTNIGELKKRFSNEYDALVSQAMSVPDNKVTLYLTKTPEGVLIPQYTNAFNKLHFLDNLSTFDVLTESKIPTLLMYGDRDKQVRVDEQLKLSKMAKNQGANIQEIVFNGRFHGLSKERDLQLFEPGFIPEVSKRISNFVKAIPK